jgi:hypothetical protein
MAAPKLEPYDLVEVWLAERGEYGADPFNTNVYKFEGSNLVLRARECPFEVGAALRLCANVANDARYMVRGRLRAFADKSMSVELLEAWNRVQQREYFRMGTGRIPIELLRQPNRRTEQDGRGKSYLCNISGGGSLIETTYALVEGEIVTMTFQLPGLAPMTLAAKVLRVVELGRRRWRSGVSFRSATADQRAEILGWVYNRQLDGRARLRQLDF